MLNKIIKELEEAKYCKHDFYQNGIDQAISIIKKHESEFNHHPLSPEDIERAAKGFRKEHLFSTSFTADVRSFTEGANFAKQPHSNEWVKVEDGLPNIGDRILCIENDGDIQIAVYGVDKVIGEKDRVTNKPIACFLDEQDEQPSFYLPTHWMPLPKNPKK